MSEIYVNTARWKKTGFVNSPIRMTIDALSASIFIRQLRGRLMHDRPLLVLGKSNEAQTVIAFGPAAEPRVAVVDGYLEVLIPKAIADELSRTVRAERGRYRVDALADLEIDVVPTEIKDGNGKVIRVVG
jgi:hypothetical protein